MDKKMIVEAFKQLLKRNLAADIKKAQNTKAPKLTGNLAKLNKPVKIANMAIKMTEALVAMNAVDALATKMHQLLPNTTDGLEWLHALPSKIANSTIGQIPVLGPIYRWINNAIAEGFAKLSEFLGNDALAAEARKRKRVDPDEGFNASFDSSKHTLSGAKKDKEEGDEDMPQKNSNSKVMKNAPSFYENLDLHKTFSIPGGYTKKTVVNGTLATPKLVVHRVFENPVPDVSALVDRLNQKFSLIKAVRGLSATNYTLIDLANYERYAKLLLHVYYTVKKVIQCAKTYNLVQVQIGDNMITALGFSPVEVRTNLANYETLLCQIHRFISNNIPMNGTWIKRSEYLHGVNIPDYSDPKVATIHQFAISMTDVFYDYDNPTDDFTFDCIPGANNNSYSVLLSNFLSYQAAIVNNSKWQQLIADYFGAFGKLAMWEDKDYPAYANPIDLRNGDSDLNREQIKNAFYENAKLELITIDDGVPNLKYRVDTDDATNKQIPGYQFGNTFNATVEATSVVLQYDTLLNGDCYHYVASGSQTLTGLGTTNKVLLPDINGVGAQTIDTVDGTNVFFSMNNHETIFTLHKDSYSEGEALEISQFKVRSIGGYVFTKSNGNVFSSGLYYKTQEYAIQDSTVYTFASNGSQIVDSTFALCNEAISDDDLQSTESPIDYPDEIMCWALIDWMPFCHFTFFGYDAVKANYFPRDVLLIDMDAFGSLDDRAFATSVNYSIYSLQGANLKIDGKTKRVSNLADVYQDKPSRKG